MPTLLPQWGGYSYTWRRDQSKLEPAQFGRGEEYDQTLVNSPFGHLIRQMANFGEEEVAWLHLRRRLEPLGLRALRGVREPREIYGLELGSKS